MDSRTFLVQGSAPDPYVVVISRDGRNLTATCTCPASIQGLACKHRLRILQGIMDGIVSGSADDVSIVCSWLKGSDVEDALQELESAESQLEAAKAHVSQTKRKLGRTLSN